MAKIVMERELSNKYPTEWMWFNIYFVWFFYAIIKRPNTILILFLFLYQFIFLIQNSIYTEFIMKVKWKWNHHFWVHIILLFAVRGVSWPFNGFVLIEVLCYWNSSLESRTIYKTLNRFYPQNGNLFMNNIWFI